MNKTIKILVFLALPYFVSCDQESIYEGEKYKNVIYMLSGTSYKTYSMVYSLNEESSVRYASVGCGGSMPNQEAVTITLGLDDNALFDKYNKSNYDIDTDSYARILPPDKYEIASYTLTLPANSPDQYVKLPIKVYPEGLSPDSIYFIPLAIQKVSRYEVNPDMSNMLYRVMIENDYAEQISTTRYLMKGTATYADGESLMVSGTKPMNPLARDKVRVFAGSDVLQTVGSKVPEIEKYAVVLQIHEDNTVTITPYGTIDVEQFSAAEWNRYSIEGKEKYFYLYYRYRTLTAPATDDTPATYSDWITIQETMRRLPQ